MARCRCQSMVGVAECYCFVLCRLCCVIACELSGVRTGSGYTQHSTIHRQDIGSLAHSASRLFSLLYLCGAVLRGTGFQKSGSRRECATSSAWPSKIRRTHTTKNESAWSASIYSDSVQCTFNSTLTCATMTRGALSAAKWVYTAYTKLVYYYCSVLNNGVCHQCSSVIDTTDHSNAHAPMAMHLRRAAQQSCNWSTPSWPNGSN